MDEYTRSSRERTTENPWVCDTPPLLPDALILTMTTVTKERQSRAVLPAPAAYVILYCNDISHVRVNALSVVLLPLKWLT